jgi:hypothetical protein
MVRYRRVDRFSQIRAIEIKIRLAGPFAAAAMVLSIVLIVERDIFYVNWAS